MAETKVTVNSQTKSINVNVRSVGSAGSIDVTPDMSKYWSDKSKDWAIKLDGKVRDELNKEVDYSSKYYANESKKQADISTQQANISKEGANQVKQTIEGFNQTVNSAIEEINTTKDDSINKIITTGSEQVSNVNTAGITQVSSVMVAGEKALTNINTAKTNAISDISIEGQTQTDKVKKEAESIIDDVRTVKENTEYVKQTVEGFNETVNEAIQEIDKTKETAISDVSSEGQIQINKIQDKVEGINETISQGIIDISQNKDNAIGSIQRERDNSLLDIEQEGNKQVQRVIDEGDTQVARVKSTGFYMEKGKLYYVDDNGEAKEFKVIGLYDENVTYSKKDVVYAIVGADFKLYMSLIDKNKGNSLTDEMWWMEIKVGGGSGSSSGLEVGSIGVDLYVDETDNTKRKLNGQVIAINEISQALLTYLKKLQALKPELFTNEENWQAEATLNTEGLCDKFVIDESAGTIRLPKFPKYIIGGLNKTAPVIGNGLPLGVINKNGSGKLVSCATAGIDASSSYTATLDTSYAQGFKTLYGTSNGIYRPVGVSTDPTQSGLIADLSEGAIKLELEYYIVIATGATTEVNIKNEIELNNPYTLFDYEYSEYKRYNSSWLVSNASYYSKTNYPKAYEGLLIEHNSEIEAGAVTDVNGWKYVKRGLPVKLSTEIFDDYDFVINQTDETFRLPIKVKMLPLGGTSPVYTSASLNDASYAAQNNLYWYSTDDKYPNKSKFSVGSENGITYAYPNNSNKANPITIANLIADLSLAENPNALLYFYVGATVQNEGLIDAGRMQEQLATKTDVKQAAHAAMPDYKTMDGRIKNTWYTAETDGYLVGFLDTTPDNTPCYLMIDGAAIGYTKNQPSYSDSLIPFELGISQGEPYALIAGTNSASEINFCKCKGAI